MKIITPSSIGVWKKDSFAKDAKVEIIKQTAIDIKINAQLHFRSNGVVGSSVSS